MQDVLDGEADRAMHLVGDGAALLGRFRAADFCRNRFQENGVVERCGIGDGVGGEVAAASAAADSPARRARLCCTAWNFEIFFSNATRSLE